MENPTSRIRIRHLCAGLCVFLSCVSGAGSEERNESAIGEMTEQAEAAAQALGEKRFFVMPVPISNPTIGSGLGAATMYLFQGGENAPPSSVTIGALWANSKSWAGGGGVNVHFKNDTYRLLGWLGYFDVNLKFFGIGHGSGDQGRSIDIAQKGPYLGPRFLRRIGDGLYLGLQYRLMTVTTTFPDLPEWIPGDILRDGIKITSSGLGPVLEYDSRDNQFNPFSGSYLEVTSNFAREALGSDRDYEQYDARFNLYTVLGNDAILAWRATACSTGGDVPFYDLCVVGGGGDEIRGYVGGQYRDGVSLSTQLEYRWRFHGKWGMVAFAGVGQIAPGFGDLRTDNLLPSYGVGARFMVSEEQRINLGVDYARGRGSSAWYFRISEAF
jgi:hypothetical protein